MATVTHRVATPDTGNTPNTSGAITFASGDLLVVYVTKEASVPSTYASGDLTATSITGVSSFTLISAVGIDGSNVDGLGVWVANQNCSGAGSTGTVTIGSGSDAGAGSNISVFTVSGLHASARGAAAIRQSGSLANQASGVVPSINFATGAVDTNNAVVGGIGVVDGTPALTPPTGWTEGADTGYTTGKAQGIETVFRNSGHTNQTVAWQTATTGGAWGGIVLELKVSVTNNDNPTGTFVVTGTEVEVYDPPSLVVARNFDGTDDVLSTSLGACNMTGAFSAAVVCRKSSDAAKRLIANTDATGTVLRWQAGLNASNKPYVQIGANSRAAPTLTATLANDWVIVVVTVASGPAVTPRFHIFKGGAWTHEDSASTVAGDPATQAGGSVLFGTNLTGWTSQDMALAAEWNSVLSDANIETLDDNSSTEDWRALSPKGLWQFNQSDVATPVTDLTGNGADELTRTGTTVSNDGPAGWDYSTVYYDDPTGSVTITGTRAESWSLGGPTNSDSPTGTLVLSGTRTEGLVFTDSCSGTLVLAGAKTDLKSAVDASSGTIVETGTETGNRVYTDNLRYPDGTYGGGTYGEGTYGSTWAFVFVLGSVAESTTRTYNDAVSGTLVLSGTAVEAISRAPSPSGTVVIAGTRVESFIGPTVYTDACSGTLVLTGTVARSASHLSSPSGVVVATGTRVESWSMASVANDNPFGTIVVSASVGEARFATETQSGSVIITGSVAESHVQVFSDTSSGTVVITGSRTESNSRTEAVAGVIVLAGTRTELFQGPQVNSDLPTGALIVTGSRTESFAANYVDSPSGIVLVSGSVQRSETRSEARSGEVVITGSVTESWRKDYSDASSGSVIVTGSVSEELRFVETNVGSIYLTGSATESTDYVAGLLGQIVITGTAGELYVPSGAAFHYPVGTIVIAGAIEELHNRWDWVDGERWAADTDGRWSEDVGERWPPDSDSRWGEDVGERWNVDTVV